MLHGSRPSEIATSRVVHSAGVLSDSLLSQQNSVECDKGLEIKATIGWNLHLLTQHDSLEHFVI